MDHSYLTFSLAYILRPIADPKLQTPRSCPRLKNLRFAECNSLESVATKRLFGDQFPQTGSLHALVAQYLCPYTTRIFSFFFKKKNNGVWVFSERTLIKKILPLEPINRHRPEAHPKTSSFLPFKLRNSSPRDFTLRKFNSLYSPYCKIFFLRTKKVERDQ